MIDWTDDKVEHLEKLRGDGFSAGQIADALSVEFHQTVSRNAVIGKLMRLGLMGNERVQKRVLQPANRRVANGNGCQTRVQIDSLRKRRARALSGETDAEPDWKPARAPDCAPVAFKDLQNGQCRFPVGGNAGPDMACCGAETIDPHAREGRRERTHCRFHFERMTGDGTASPRRPVKRKQFLLGVGY